MTKDFDHKREFKGGWIGVDFDGTLAEYTGWKGADVLGKPLMPMVNRVRRWLAQGITVRIVTARACPVKPEGYENDIPTAVAAIHKWCIEQFGQPLVVTYQKDYNMIELWDDRAVQVEANTGEVVSATSRVKDIGDITFRQARELQSDAMLCKSIKEWKSVLLKFRDKYKLPDRAVIDLANMDIESMKKWFG